MSAQRAPRRLSRRTAGATVLALGGLLSTYAQVVRAPSAYAAACANVTDTASLNTALAGINAGTCDTVNVTASFTLTADGTPVDIAASGATAVVVNGNGHTITGGLDPNTPGSGFRPFDFTLGSGDTLAMSNLTITAARPSSEPTYRRVNPGALRVDGNAAGVTVTLTNVSLTNNRAWTDSYGTIRNGGAAGIIADQVTITGGTISGNRAEDGGALYLEVNALSLTGALVTDNDSEDGGGAIYLTGSLDNTPVTIANSTFNGNYADGEGGAIYIEAGAVATITNTTFTSNEATGDGGAVQFAYGYITVAGSTFTGNTAEGQAGALNVYAGGLTMSNSTLTGNTSTTGEGGAIYSHGLYTSTITDSVFRNNSAPDSGGGALYLEMDDDSDTLTLTRTVFDHNSALTTAAPYANGRGGAVFTDGNLVVTDSTFTMNDALDGGAIYVLSGAYVGTPPTTTVTGSTFHENTATNLGGAIQIGARYFQFATPPFTSGPNPLTITNSTLTGNTAMQGAAVNAEYSPVQIIGSTVMGNGNGSTGGAVLRADDNSSLEIVRTAIVGNTANGLDEPLILADGNISLENSTVTGNTSTGSVLDAIGTSYIDVNFSTIIDNAQYSSTPLPLTSSYSLRSKGSVLFTGSGTSGALSDGFNPANSYDFTVTNETFGSGNDTNSQESVTEAALKLGALLTPTAPGRPSLVPASDSVLVTGAPDNSLGTLIVSDQLGVTRGPSGTANSFVIGARSTGTGPVLVNASPGNGSQNVAYPGYTFTGSGTGPLEFVLGGGGLPPGLVLDRTTGALTGTPTTIGSYGFTIMVTNPFGQSVPANVVIEIGSAATRPTFTQDNPPRTAVKGSRYAGYRFVATGTAPITYAVASGALPAGLTLDPTTGQLSGTPTTTGSSTFTVSATNSAGAATSRTITITVSATAPQPTPQVLPRKLRPGQFLVTEGSVRVPVEVRARSNNRGVAIVGPDFAMTLDGLNSRGKPMNLGPDGVLVLATERDVETSGRGFKPNSDVNLYVDPEVRRERSGRSIPEAIYVGTVRTDARGTFRGTATLPDGISVGVHDLQAVGVTPENTLRSMSLGVLVSDVPGAVRNLRVTGTSAAGSADLAWRAPLREGRTPVTSYVVHYRSTAGGGWIRSGATPDRVTTVAELIPGCSYYFSVTARNEVGGGPREVVGAVQIPMLTGPTPRGDLRCLVQ